MRYWRTERSKDTTMQTIKPADSSTPQPPQPSVIGEQPAALDMDLRDRLQAGAPATRSRWKRAAVVLPLLCAGLLVAILFATAIGAVHIGIGAITKILLNSTGLFHFHRSWDTADEIIIFQLRLPRVIGASLVGAALAVAGVLFQGMLRNPLADPFLIGTSSGAALGAAIAFILPFDTIYGAFFPLTPVLAFVGAIVTVMLVYAIARVDGHTPVVTLLLAG